MPDARTLVDQLDQFRKDQLLKRFQTLAQREYRTGDDQIDNLRVLALPDIEAAFAEDFIADYDHTFVAETPAKGLIDLVCPGCHQVIPDVGALLTAVLTREGDGPGKVKVKASVVARTHVCGQQAIPKPAEPEVKDQEEMFSDSEVSALDQLRERAKAERAADDISDDDLTKPDEGEGAE